MAKYPKSSPLKPRHRAKFSKRGGYLPSEYPSRYMARLLTRTNNLRFEQVSESDDWGGVFKFMGAARWIHYIDWFLNRRKGAKKTR